MSSACSMIGVSDPFFCQDLAKIVMEKMEKEKIKIGKSSQRKIHCEDKLRCMLCFDDDIFNEVLARCWKRHCRIRHKDFITFRMAKEAVSEEDAVTATFEDHVSSASRDLKQIRDFMELAMRSRTKMSNFFPTFSIDQLDNVSSSVDPGSTLPATEQSSVTIPSIAQLFKDAALEKDNPIDCIPSSDSIVGVALTKKKRAILKKEQAASRKERVDAARKIVQLKREMMILKCRVIAAERNTSCHTKSSSRKFRSSDTIVCLLCSKKKKKRTVLVKGFRCHCISAHMDFILRRAELVGVY